MKQTLLSLNLRMHLRESMHTHTGQQTAASTVNHLRNFEGCHWVNLWRPTSTEKVRHYVLLWRKSAFCGTTHLLQILFMLPTNSCVMLLRQQSAPYVSALTCPEMSAIQWCRTNSVPPSYAVQPVDNTPPPLQLSSSAQNTPVVRCAAI